MALFLLIVLSLLYAIFYFCAFAVATIVLIRAAWRDGYSRELLLYGWIALMMFSWLTNPDGASKLLGIVGLLGILTGAFYADRARKQSS